MGRAATTPISGTGEGTGLQTRGAITTLDNFVVGCQRTVHVGRQALKGVVCVSPGADVRRCSSHVALL
jgi:hypothetical protein